MQWKTNRYELECTRVTAKSAFLSFSFLQRPIFLFTRAPYRKSFVNQFLSQVKVRTGKHGMSVNSANCIYFSTKSIIPIDKYLPPLQMSEHPLCNRTPFQQFVLHSTGHASDHLQTRTDCSTKARSNLWSGWWISFRASSESCPCTDKQCWAVRCRLAG